MKQDTFKILNDKNETLTMEIINVFEINGYPYHYIIYTELDHSHYYLAKYTGENIVDLITEFDDAEFAMANEVFNKVVAE